MNTSPATYERLRAMRHAEQSAAELAARIKAEAAPPETRDEQIARVAAEQVADAKARLATATPAEREALKRRIAMHGAVAADADKRQAEAERVEKFHADPMYQNAMKHYEVFRKNPGVAVPGVTAEAAALCGAILQNQDWQSPQDASKAYWTEVTKAEDAAYQAARNSAAQAEHDKLKADVVAANAKVAEVERRQALDKSRANLEAADGSQ